MHNKNTKQAQRTLFDIFFLLCKRSKVAKGNKNNENKKPTNFPVFLKIKRITWKSERNVLKTPSANCLSNVAMFKSFWHSSIDYIGQEEIPNIYNSIKYIIINLNWSITFTYYLIVIIQCSVLSVNNEINIHVYVINVTNEYIAQLNISIRFMCICCLSKLSKWSSLKPYSYCLFHSRGIILVISTWNYSSLTISLL